MKSIIFVLMFVLSSITVMAQDKEYILLNDKNDSTDDSHIKGQIAVTVDENMCVKSLIQRKIDGRDGSLMKQSIYTVQQVLDGIVLEEKRGFKIITMKAEKFDQKNGATLVIDYLSNGITGARKSQKLFAKPIDNSWSVIDENGQKVSGLMIETNKLGFLGSIGIKSIKPLEQL